MLAASADLDTGIAELEAALASGADDAASVSAAAYALGRAHMQQIRFAEAEQLMVDTLERLTDAPEPLRARLHALHAWAVSAQGRSDGVLEEVATARAMADRAADPHLTLEVLEHATSAADEVGVGTDEGWAELERRARDLDAWHQVVVAGRIRGIYRAMTDPVGALPDLEQIADLARAHGQLEQAGWCDYARCELLWVLGRWDEALAVGSDIVDIAERNAYERLAFRTYVVILPMAAVRLDPALATRYEAWLRSTDTHRPAVPSPYARVLQGAISVWLAQAW